MDAAVVELKDGKVALKKRDGTTIKVSLENLSEVDQEYVKQLVRDNDDVPDENAQPSKRSKQSAPPASAAAVNRVRQPTFPLSRSIPASADAKLMSVVVTGAGTGPRQGQVQRPVQRRRADGGRAGGRRNACGKRQAGPRQSAHLHRGRRNRDQDSRSVAKGGPILRPP